MKLSRTLTAASALAVFAVAGLSGCKPDSAVKKGAPIGRASTVPGTAPAPTATAQVADAGAITGTVHFTGKVPAPVKIDMSMDPACAMTAGDNMSEAFVTSGSGLGNVYVYVKSGATPSQASASSPVVMDQHGCRYTPHVIALQQGGTVEFRNTDPTMHNVHTVPTVGGNPVVDVSQGPGASPQQRRFAQPEVMLPVGCNNHPWMRAYINVSPTPYFAVSAADGTFNIAGLPPGTYTLAAVHEKLGEQDVQVTIPARASVKANFTFAAK